MTCYRMEKICGVPSNGFPACLQNDTDRPVQSLVQDAIFRFDLSPKDAEFLIVFFKQSAEK